MLAGQLFPLGSISEEHYDQSHTNVKAVLFHGAKLCLIPEAAHHFEASVVSIKGYGGSSVYSRLRRGASFARLTRTEGSQDRVNVISPGPIDTRSLKAWEREEQAALKAQLWRRASGA